MKDANDYSRFEDVSDSDEEVSTTPASSVSASERLQQIGTAKTTGNDLIGKGEHKAAAAQYRKGLKIVEDLAKAKGGDAEANPIQLHDSKELELSLQLNLAMAEIKLENWASAKKAAAAAVAIEPTNVKALFRRGMALARSGSFEEATVDLNKCLELDSANGSAKKELAWVKKKAADAKKQEKAGFGGMFGKKGGAGFYDDREAAREAKAAAKAAEEAKRREEWEAAMVKEEAAHEEARAAALAEEKAAAAAEAASGPETPSSSPDSDDEDLPSAPFKRTPFDEWRQKQDEAKKAAEEAAQAEEEARKAKAAAAKREALKASRAEEAAKAAATELELDEEDAALVAEVASKGYCHFRHQNTAEEAALIGSIAPKKVSAGEDAGPGSGSTANNNNNNHQSNHSQGPQRIDTKGGNGGGGGASAWNSAGTWEEKDCSSWAHTCLTKYLKTAHAAAGVGDESLTNSPEAVVKALDGLDMTATSSTDQADKLGLLAAALAKMTVKVKSVKKVEGDASVCVVRGTKRYLFDLNADLDYEVHVDESFGMDANDDSGQPARQSTYQGTMKLRDLTWDQSGVEVSFVPKAKGAKVPPAHAARVTSVLESLKRDVLKRCVDAFASEFQSTH